VITRDHRLARADPKRIEPGFYEFFAGAGMARLGLGAGWRCLFANEICEKKAAAYRANFPPAHELAVRDVATLTCDDLPPGAALAWASFPCQDLSLAGAGRGLRGERSGAFLPFWRLMDGLARTGRAVPLIVLENVVGALTSNGGGDFRTLLEIAADSGYRAGALVVDAIHFAPQSRPRLFVIAVDDRIEVAGTGEPSQVWHTRRIRNAYAGLPDRLKRRWIWWHLPAPPPRSTTLASVLDRAAEWDPSERTDKILSLMAPAHLQRVRAMQANGGGVGAVYKRIRTDGRGRKVQRAEVRFDGISGCLRTPAGGSSRQIVIAVDSGSVRTRLLAPREAARLMGVPEHYVLPENYNQAYHLMGDGVVVPAVAWLERHLLRPLLAHISGRGLLS
jgi:DNA (cytosine-5)-methyltransferase 1